MTTGEIVNFSIYVIGALILSMVGVLALGAALAAEQRCRRLIVPTLYSLIIVSMGISTVISGRNVSMLVLGISSISAYPDLASKWFTHLVVVTTLTACVARIVAALFSRENRGIGGVGLFVAFCLFFLTNTVLNSAFGTAPKFLHYLYYTLFLFAAVFASRTEDPEIAIRFLKWGLLIFLAASCVVSVVAPDIAIQKRFAGWLPVATIRFWGLGPHPNSIGPLASLFLLLAIHQPFARRWLHYLGFVIAVVVLLLAQSKTAWVVTAITVPMLLVLRLLLPRSSDDRRGAHASYTMGLATTSVLTLGVLGVSAVLVLTQLGISVGRILASTVGDELATLTGRDIIWNVAINEWTRNPLFGYGVTMWDDAYRMQIGLWYAFSAHNQFLQSLGAAGLVGLIGLIVYLGVLLRYAIAAQRATLGLSLVLFIFVLSRCLTETPLSTETFLSGEFLTHLLLFHIALVHGCRVVSARRSPEAILSLRRTS